VSGETPDTGPRPERRWWREAPTLVAVVGLFVALVFNTVGVWQSNIEQKQVRESEQIRLLTELNAYATETERAINATDAPDERCLPRRTDTLPDNQAARLFAALDYYEFLAWLFNHRRLTIDSAREYWAPNMIDAYRLGHVFYARGVIDSRYPELRHFRVRTEPALLPGDPCP
jgi:hypothetical protein